MTEIEYIQAIRDAAERYIEVIREPATHGKDAKRRLHRWQMIKENLSAHSMVRLCDLWLGNEGTTSENRAPAGEEASAATIEA